MDFYQTLTIIAIIIGWIMSYIKGRVDKTRSETKYEEKTKELERRISIIERKLDETRDTFFRRLDDVKNKNQSLQDRILVIETKMNGTI